MGKEENEEEYLEEEENTMEEDNQPNCEDPDFIVRLFLTEAQMQQQTIVCRPLLITLEFLFNRWMLTMTQVNSPFLKRRERK